ncbi:MAG: hypothetical protein ACK56I_33215, partial [bacterium]
MHEHRRIAHAHVAREKPPWRESLHGVRDGVDPFAGAAWGRREGLHDARAVRVGLQPPHAPQT